MEVCLFLIGYSNGMHPKPRDIDISLIQAVSQNVEGLRRFVIHRSEESTNGDPQSKEHALKPRWVLQWYFDDLDPAEAALQRGGAAHTIVEQAIDAAQDRLAVAQQLMAVRKFATPNARGIGDPSEKCTYLVGYEGEAQNFNAWLTH